MEVFILVLWTASVLSDFLLSRIPSRKWFHWCLLFKDMLIASCVVLYLVLHLQTWIFGQGNWHEKRDLGSYFYLAPATSRPFAATEGVICGVLSYTSLTWCAMWLLRNNLSMRGRRKKNNHARKWGIIRRAIYNAKELLSSKVRRDPLPGQRRTNWTCVSSLSSSRGLRANQKLKSCGIKLYADLDDVDSTTDLEFDLQSLQGGSESPGSFQLQPLSYPGASLARSSSSTGASSSQVQSSSRSNSGLNMRSISHQRCDNASQDGDSCKRWLELSMPRAKYTIELNEIETSAAHLDGELFDRIRSAYSTSKFAADVSAWAKLPRQLSWARISRPCGVEFIRVSLHNKYTSLAIHSPTLVSN
jgi:hypothetical protein